MIIPFLANYKVSFTIYQGLAAMALDAWQIRYILSYMIYELDVIDKSLPKAAFPFISDENIINTFFQLSQTKCSKLIVLIYEL